MGEDYIDWDSSVSFGSLFAVRSHKCKQYQLLLKPQSDADLLSSMLRQIGYVPPPPISYCSATYTAMWLHIKVVKLRSGRLRIIPFSYNSKTKIENRRVSFFPLRFSDLKLFEMSNNSSPLPNAQSHCSTELELANAHLGLAYMAIGKMLNEHSRIVVGLHPVLLLELS
jgi:hypothetical protein